MVLFKCREASPLDKFFRFYIPIWFYSNFFIRIINSMNPYLHSNMVLFKYLKVSDDSTYVEFTFQYGSIQMNLILICFQYCFLIYIPIWFYSNEYRDYGKLDVISFTFQYGSIQISR